MDYDDDLLNFEELDNEIQNIMDQSEYQNYLKMQLEEIDILRAMYYKDREFIIDDKILKLVDCYLKGETLELPPTIDFLINMPVDEISFEIQVVLPKQYPAVEPHIFVRCKQMISSQVISLNSDLKSLLKSIHRGSICVLECILWIGNNIRKYKEPVKVDTKESIEEKLFSRYWIYSHHIYSKEKRKFIVSLSKEFSLTGFCLSGKPGIICVEGWDCECSAWWQQVKNLTWKKIACIKMEQLSIAVPMIDAHRRFEDFGDISFQNNAKTNKTDSHSDMGEFYKYLMDHSCGYVFKDYFGFEGKISSLN